MSVVVITVDIIGMAMAPTSVVTVPSAVTITMVMLPVATMRIAAGFIVTAMAVGLASGGPFFGGHGGVSCTLFTAGRSEGAMPGAAGAGFLGGLLIIVLKVVHNFVPSFISKFDTLFQCLSFYCGVALDLPGLKYFLVLSTS